MTKNVSWIFEITIKEGQLDNLKKLMSEMVEATLAHLATFTGQYAARLMEAGDATSFVVYGNPNDEVKKILDGFNAVYMVPIGGFMR